MKLSSAFACVATLCTLAGCFVDAAIELNIDDDESIKKAAGRAAYDMMTYYTGNETGDVPGNLPDPYYWVTTPFSFPVSKYIGVFDFLCRKYCTDLLIVGMRSDVRSLWLSTEF